MCLVPGVKANLLLTHFANFKWTHPYSDERKKALFFAANFQPHSCAEQWRRKVYHLRNMVSRSLCCSPLS